MLDVRKMKKTILILGIWSLIVFGCTPKDTTFLISENSVGPLNRDTSVEDIRMVFAQDSVVQDTTNLQVGAKAKKIHIFEKGGKHLLTLTPNADSIPTIENVRVFDARYVSDKGIGLNSTFQDIQHGYGIKKIVTTLNSIVVFPKGSNLYFTIDKEELPDNLRYATTSIEAVQIPNTAKIKYLMMGWE